VHRPGASNIADYYSRHPVKASATSLSDSKRAENYVNWIARCAIPSAITVEEVKQASQADMEQQKLIQWLDDHTDRNTKFLPLGLSEYKNVINELEVTDKRLLLRSQRLVIPQALRARIIALAHVGHQGITKTKALIRSRVWYPGIDRQVEQAVRICRECQANVDRQKFEPLKPSPMPAGPWQELNADFLGPLDDGTYMLVSQCDYSNWANVDIVKSTSFAVIKPHLVRLFSFLGVPLVYKTDNGPPFMSHEFAEFAKQWGFTHRKVTPYWPRANGKSESFMKKLGKVLRAAEIAGISRSQALVDFLRIYRETPHSTTKVAPNMLLFGFSRSSGIPKLENSKPDFDELKRMHEWAQDNVKDANNRMQQEYDKRMRAQDARIGVGSRVLLKRSRTNKTMSAWDPDPFTVTAVLGSMVTAARAYPAKQELTRNSSMFKPFRFSEDEDEDTLPGQRRSNGLDSTLEERREMVPAKEPAELENHQPPEMVR
jgi:hypothetical protein